MSDDLLDQWIFNLELECSGASLSAIEEIAIGGAVLDMRGLLMLLTQSRRHRELLLQSREMLAEHSASCIRQPMRGRCTLAKLRDQIDAALFAPEEPTP